jgi:hypothetical protein
MGARVDTSYQTFNEKLYDHYQEKYGADLVKLSEDFGECLNSRDFDGIKYLVQGISVIQNEIVRIMWELRAAEETD